MENMNSEQCLLGIFNEFMTESLYHCVWQTFVWRRKTKKKNVIAFYTINKKNWIFFVKYMAYYV